MKKGLFLLAFCLFSFGISAQEFKFEKEVINYGKIVKGSNGTRIFNFTNIGNAPLIISDIKTSCDCAVPKRPEAPIMPGEKASITVSYDTSNTGGFSKTIIIFSNAKNERKKIKVKGYITK